MESHQDPPKQTFPLISKLLHSCSANMPPFHFSAGSSSFMQVVEELDFCQRALENGRQKGNRKKKAIAFFYLIAFFQLKMHLQCCVSFGCTAK